MKANTRTAIIQATLALAFLAAFFAIDFASSRFGASGVTFGLVVPFSPILLVVSAIVGVRTVIDLLDGITDQNKRRVRGWSLTSIAFSLAVIALTIGFGVVTAPVTGDPVIDDEVIRAFATILLILTPFLLPIITLIYSLSGRAPRQVPHTMEMAGS